MKYITTLTVIILSLLVVTRDIASRVAMDVWWGHTGVHSAAGKPGREDLSRTTPLLGRIDFAGDEFAAITPSAAQYSESDRTWTVFAEVIQLKDVSIYGRPGTIARVEYLKAGEPEYAWVAIRIDDYDFSDDADTLTAGKQIVLEVSGEYVSSKGVNWDACPQDDQYCQYASFIEGGFPISEDYNGLTICPSNTLIYSGHASDDWVNGVLAWRVRSNTRYFDERLHSLSF
jgi:hypothetical protein